MKKKCAFILKYGSVAMVWGTSVSPLNAPQSTTHRISPIEFIRLDESTVFSFNFYRNPKIFEIYFTFIVLSARTRCFAGISDAVYR